MIQCQICDKDIDDKNTYFVLSLNKEVIEEGTKETIQSDKVATICEECGQEGLHSVLRNIKLIHDSDTKLNEKMQLIVKSINMMDLMKAYGISGEKVGTRNQYLTACPLHNQESSFLIDTDNKEYFCLCEGLKGDIFSFVINYERDVNQKHMTLKQAVDFLKEKFQIQ